MTSLVPAQWAPLQLHWENYGVQLHTVGLLRRHTEGQVTVHLDLAQQMTILSAQRHRYRQTQKSKG